MHGHITPTLRRVILATGAALLLSLAIAAAASATGIRLFQSPSGNIGCVIVRGGGGAGQGAVRCDIGEHSWTAPPKPHSCDLDWGGGVSVGKHGHANYVCAGDTTLHQGPVLAYGDSKEFGGFKCKSNTQSMRCHSKKSGHGFSLSRDQVKFF